MNRYLKEGEAVVHLPELMTGDVGHAVGIVQVMLNLRGYHIQEDPPMIFSKDTEAAVARFQAEKGMTPTGTVNAGTWALLLLLG